MAAMTKPKMDFLVMTCDLAKSKYVVSNLMEKHKEAVIK